MTSDLSTLLCVAADPQWHQHAKRFSDANTLSFFNSQDVETFSDLPHTYVLSYEPDGLFLKQAKKGGPGAINPSFLVGKNAHRRQFGGGKGQLIAKAVGIKPGLTPMVLDATAGLGRDAFVLASLGCQVQMLENSPIVHELLRWALEEAGDSEIEDVARRMQLERANAVEWLAGHAERVADVIYLDPMYPHRDKSAAVKKEMRAFHDLVGPSEDEEALLEIALQRARYRVVVKRPRKGVTISGATPSYQLAGKSSRYDIYTLASIDHLKNNA